MLTDDKVTMIQRQKGTSTMCIQFIKDFDREWDAAVERLRNSGADLSKILLTEKHTEYKNVRTSLWILKSYTKQTQTSADTLTITAITT